MKRNKAILPVATLTPPAAPPPGRGGRQPKAAPLPASKTPSDTFGLKAGSGIPNIAGADTAAAGQSMQVTAQVNGGAPLPPAADAAITMGALSSMFADALREAAQIGRALQALQSKRIADLPHGLSDEEMGQYVLVSLAREPLGELQQAVLTLGVVQ